MNTGSRIVKLGDVCSLDRIHNKGAALPYVGLEDIVSGEGRFIGSTEPKKVQSSTFKFTPEHILYGRLRPYLNKVYLPDFGGHCSTEIFPIRLTFNADRRYLYYWLTMESTVKEIDRTSTGARMPRANVEAILDFPIPLPPLPEQQRIVAILDEAFAGLATATANAEKNLKNARELFESNLNATFEQTDRTWQTKSLEELCEDDRIITYGVIKLGREFPSGVPCLRTSNVRWLRIDLEGIKRIAPDLSKEFRRTILRGGEVLVNVRGTLGGVAVVQPGMKGWNVSREVAVVPVDAGRIESAYLAHFIATKRSQNWLTDVQKGLAYVGINIADLRTLPISFPGRNRQLQLIARLQELSYEARKLEAIYNRRLLQLAELRQAILHAAFSGELTSAPSQAIREAAE